MAAPSAFLAFTFAAALLTITPGLDTALILRTWLSEGRGAAVRALLGVQVGCFAWGCAVAVGLGAVLVAAPAVYAALRWTGAIYLGYCGATLLLRPRGALVVTQGPRSGRAFRRGVFTNLLNPKIGLFYLSFLPGFVPLGWPAAPTMVGLTLIHIGMTLAWFALLLGGAAGVRRLLTARAGVARALDRITGVVFIGFGLRLALDRG